MKICGIQKTTLIDYPGKVACTLFLYGCNFRCGFCHNPELVILENSSIIREEEILEFLRKRKYQLEGVCITGGEPLMSIDKEFLKKIKELGFAIKIDTNGSFPERLNELINEELVDFVAMDIKASKEKYSEVSKMQEGVEKIEESIKIISKLKNYEFRTTIVEGIHDIEEVEKISNWLNLLCGNKPKKYVLQGFKNQGKFINSEFHHKKDSSKETLEKMRETIKDKFERVEIRD